MAIGETLLEVCERAARAGGAELLAWRGRFRVEEKAQQDFVTDADRASQQAVRQAILDQFPDHGFLGEEDPHPAELEKPYCWVVDPLDGTTNYVHDFPFFAVSVAVAEAGRLVAATILDPLRNECFTAQRGEGARLNGQALTVSRTTKVADSLVAVSFPPHTELDSPDVAAFLQVAPRCRAVRRTGSAALNLAYVACGRLDAHWAHFIHPWDSAAGVLLVEEAGGVVTDSRGHQFRLAEGNYFAACNPTLHRELLPLVTAGIEKNV